MPEIKSVVVSYRPGLVYLTVAVCGAMVVLALFLGKLWGGQEFTQQMSDKRQLELLAEELSVRVEEQQDELSRIRLSSQVDIAALENSRQEMIVLQRSIYKRDEELKLYRELLRDKDQPDGLSVAHLRLTPLDDGSIDYSWVEISFQELDAEITEFPLRLEFKYFSLNRGLLRLPENFEPEKIRIVLRYPWMERAQFDKKFEWKIEV